MDDLYRAAQSGNEKALKSLLEEPNADINVGDKKGRTILSLAAMNRRTNIVKILLQKDGINIESKDHNDRTALSLAAFNESPEIVELLLDHGAQVDSKDKQGETALSLATKRFSTKKGYDREGYTEEELQVIRLLVEKGADVNNANEEGNTPMIYAASSNMKGPLLQLLSPQIHRRIIICCDGTWNDRETKKPFTNVARIMSCIESRDDRDDCRYEQLPHYVPGIGTGRLWLGKYISGATGSG